MRRRVCGHTSDAANNPEEQTNQADYLHGCFCGLTTFNAETIERCLSGENGMADV
jgi:hypothetical protein